MTEAYKIDMKTLASLILLLLPLTVSIWAQDSKAEQAATSQAAQTDTRGEMLRAIGLTPDQMRQMRRANMERKPLMEEAQRRLREANHLLDEAIYADEVNDADVRSRLKEAQAAQAEVFRIRSTNELAIRKILNPDQLTKFRELRKRFEEQARENMQVRRKRERMNRAGDPASTEFRSNPRRLRPIIRQGQPIKQP